MHDPKVVSSNYSDSLLNETPHESDDELMAIKRHRLNLLTL